MHLCFHFITVFVDVTFARNAYYNFLYFLFDITTFWGFALSFVVGYAYMLGSLYLLSLFVECLSNTDISVGQIVLKMNKCRKKFSES
jgi:hypothetical protein